MYLEVKDLKERFLKFYGRCFVWLSRHRLLSDVYTLCATLPIVYFFGEFFGHFSVLSFLFALLYSTFFIIPGHCALEVWIADIAKVIEEIEGS